MQTDQIHMSVYAGKKLSAEDSAAGPCKEVEFSQSDRYV